MKKLLTLFVALILAMGVLGFAACGAKTMTSEEFMAELTRIEAETYADDSLHYDTVSYRTIEKAGENPQTTDTGTDDLIYRIDGDGNKVAETENGLTVLGLSNLMAEYIEAAENNAGGKFTVKKVGSDFDVTSSFDNESTHWSVHYIFNQDGYVTYFFEKEEGEYMVEFTATAYNKAATTNALAGKTFTVVSVEEANDPTYNDYLSSEFAVYIGSTVEFKTNGTFEWTTDRVAIFGTYTVNGNAGTYTQTGWIENGETEEIPVENRMALDIAVSGNDIVLTVVFVIGGESGAYDMVDCHINATLNNNL